MNKKLNFSRMRSMKFTHPAMKAALLAPFSIPFVGVIFSLLQPMPQYQATTGLGLALEYLGLFSVGALVLGFPLGLIYGYPVLRLTSRYCPSNRMYRYAATLTFSLLPSVVLIGVLGEMNYFTNLCVVVSLTTAFCAQYLLLKIEGLERRRVNKGRTRQESVLGSRAGDLIPIVGSDLK